MILQWVSCERVMMRICVCVADNFETCSFPFFGFLCYCPLCTSSSFAFLFVFTQHNSFFFFFSLQSFFLFVFLSLSLSFFFFLLFVSLHEHTHIHTQIKTYIGTSGRQHHQDSSQSKQNNHQGQPNRRSRATGTTLIVQTVMLRGTLSTHKSLIFGRTLCLSVFIHTP